MLRSLGTTVSLPNTGRRCALRIMESTWMTDITREPSLPTSGSTIHMPLSGSGWRDRDPGGYLGVGPSRGRDFKSRSSKRRAPDLIPPSAPTFFCFLFFEGTPVISPTRISSMSGKTTGKSQRGKTRRRVSRSTRAGLQFSVARSERFLRSYHQRVAACAPGM